MLTFSSDLRRPCLRTGKSMSSTKNISVLRKVFFLYTVLFRALGSMFYSMDLFCRASLFHVNARLLILLLFSTITHF